MNKLHNELRKIISIVKTVDDFIVQFYSSITSSLDSTISHIDMSPLCKRILYSKQLLFYLVLICNFILIYSTTSTEFTLNFILFHCFILSYSITLVSIFFLKFQRVDDMYITRNEELERHILAQNKELMNNQCQVCKLTRCMRSYHCGKCDKCVAKFELHSDWFHVCIGSNNFLPYFVTLTLLNILYVTSILLLSFGESKSNRFVFDFWLLFIFYLSVKNCCFSKDLYKTSLARNLTQYEAHNWKRLPYLWRNMRKEFFNPFDKGWSANAKEMWTSFVNQELQLSDRINLKLNCNKNLNEEGDSVMILNVDTVNNEDTISADTVSNEDNISVSGDLFISEDNKVIYCRYTGNKEDILNWSRVRLYSVFDLLNSPLRDILVKQMQVN